MKTDLPGRRGVVLTLLGVTALSPDGLLTTMIGANIWTTLFWRGLLVGIALLLWLAVRHRSHTIAALRAVGWPGLGIGILFAASSTGFVTAIRLSTVADTLFILSAAPLFAALISRFALGAPVARHTWITIAVAITGMFVIFGGKLNLSDLFGILAALGAAIAWAGMLVALGQARLSDPTPAMAFGALLIAISAAAFAPDLSVEPSDYLPIALLGVVFLPISFALISRGPRYLPAAEVGLILLLEAVFGPLLAWAVIAQTPSVPTLAGGAIILLALTAHFSLDLHRARS